MTLGTPAIADSHDTARDQSKLGLEPGWSALLASLSCFCAGTVSRPEQAVPGKGLLGVTRISAAVLFLNSHEGTIM
jgi:hypothetical protein